MCGPGDSVEVWFSGAAQRDGQRVESEHFTYTVEQDSGRDVLVIANEDYTGVNPDYPPATAPKYLDEHVAALAANGVTADVWDVDAAGRAARPRCAQPLRHGSSGTWATTGSPRIPRTS